MTDYARLAADLREVVRLQGMAREAVVAGLNHTAQMAYVDLAQHVDAIAVNGSLAALLALAEGAAKGPVAAVCYDPLLSVAWTDAYKALTLPVGTKLYALTGPKESK